MDKLDVKEKIWGGIFGAIAIIAAIAEMMANGLSAASVFGAIKDIAGTAVVVLILCVFLKGIKRPKNIAEILEKAVEEWGDKNAPLIFKADGYVAAKDTPYTQGYLLLQNPKDYVGLVNAGLTKESPEWREYAAYGKGHSTGKFFDIPCYDKMTQEDFAAQLTMEQSHFKTMPEELTGQIVTAVNFHCKGIKAKRVGNSRTIKLTCNKINTKDDVNTFVDGLDFILSLVKVIA